MGRAALVVLVSAAGWAHADEVHLKSGGRLSGEVVSEDARSVVVEVGPGRVTVPAAQILRIERSRSALGEYRERAGHLEADDVQGWLTLAFWALERDLATQAQEAFERVLRVDPGNASANAALGRVQMDGAWMSLDESYRRRGYVQLDGRWMTPAEHEAALRARAADESAAALRESQRRVREAEARATEAEAAAREAEQAAQEADGIPLWWGWGGGGGIARPPVVRPPHRPPPSTLMPPIPRPPPPEKPPPTPRPDPPPRTSTKGVP